MSRYDRWVRRCAIGLIVLSAVTAAASLLWLRSPTLRASIRGVDERPGYPVGTQIDVPPSIFDSREVTIVLFVKSGCGACQDSQIFFGTLVAIGKDAVGAETRLVAFDTDAEAGVYAEAIGLDPSDVVPLPREEYVSLAVAKVPTLVIVDRKGTVKLEHIGKPTVEDERDIVAFVESLGH